MLDNTKIAIILPTRNRAALLLDAIASVQSQTFRDWLLLIVDDGSTDDTPSVVEPFLVDQRIAYHRARFGSVAAARNFGLGAATSELVAYIDSDNLWHDEFLEKAFGALVDHPEIDLVYAQLTVLSPDQSLSQMLFVPFNRAQLLIGNYIDMNVIVHRRSLVSLCGGFDESLTRLVDWDLVLRYTQCKAPLPLPVSGAIYRTHAEGRISNVQLFGVNFHAVFRKGYWRPHHSPQIRVLCLLVGSPQVAAVRLLAIELRFLKRCGIIVQLWTSSDGWEEAPFAVDKRPVADVWRASSPMSSISISWMGEPRVRTSRRASRAP